MKVDLQNDFTTGYDQNPKNRQGYLMILYKHIKYSVIQQTTSEVKSLSLLTTNFLVLPILVIIFGCHFLLVPINIHQRHP